MTEFIAAADEVAATQLVGIAQGELGTQSTSGSDSLGPFNASWSASASFSDGTVDLIAPNVIRIANCDLNYTLNFVVSLDLSDILPDFCLPEACVDIPWVGRVCTPSFCIDWPTIEIPVSHSGTLEFTADFNLNVHLSGGYWQVDLVIVGVPSLQFGPQAAAILAAIGAAASLVLWTVPFIGPFLAGTVATITALIVGAGLTGFLGTIITPFVSGLTFTIYRQPQIQQVFAATDVDSAVTVTLDTVATRVDSTDEDELVLTADISP